MVERVGEALSAAADEHVETVRNEIRGEAGVGHADDVSCITAALQAVNKDHFGARVFRRLSLHQHLRGGLGANQAGFHWPTREVELPGPEISQDGEKMGVSNQR